MGRSKKGGRHKNRTGGGNRTTPTARVGGFNGLKWIAGPCLMGLIRRPRFAWPRCRAAAPLRPARHNSSSRPQQHRRPQAATGGTATALLQDAETPGVPGAAIARYCRERLGASRGASALCCVALRCAAAGGEKK